MVEVVTRTTGRAKVNRASPSHRGIYSFTRTGAIVSPAKPGNRPPPELNTR